MISDMILDELELDALYELGCQVVEALNRRAYAAECLTEELQEIKDTDMDTN